MLLGFGPGDAVPVKAAQTPTTESTYTHMTSKTDTIVYGHGGGMYTVVPEGASPTKLLPGTYGISFNEMVGHRLTTLPDLQPPTHRVYGRQDAIIAKVIATYGKFARSLGVLFSGDKGIGKSSTTLELARQARDTFGLPIIMVTGNSPGLATFLASLGECVVVFDEFEKNFPVSYENQENQDQFLSLFDGTDTVKRLYMITINDSNKISPFFLNRPGRFHYLINFDYPTEADIRDYLTYETNGTATAEQIAEVTIFARKARLNYDHLRAIVTELALAPSGAEVGELLADLNIRDTGDNHLAYTITTTFADNRLSFSEDTTVNLFSPETDRLRKRFSSSDTLRFLESLGYTFDSEVMHSSVYIGFRGSDVTDLMTIEPEGFAEHSYYVIECYNKADIASLGLSKSNPGVTLHDNDTELRISLDPVTVAALPRPLAEALTIRSIQLESVPLTHGRYNLGRRDHLAY